MSDEKPLSKSDENHSAQENEIKPVSIDANPVVEEIAMPESNPEVPDNAPPEESPQTPSQSEELTNEAIADELETPLQGDAPLENEIPQATETPECELLQLLKSIGEANTELLQQLVKDFDVKLKYDAAKQEQIDKLYEENQDYKQGIIEKYKKNLVLAVIGQIDAAFKTIEHFGNQEFSEENYRKLLKNYNEIATDFQDSLAQSFDVTAFESEENTPFDAKSQRALKTVPTEDEAKHKTISKSLRQGYELENADGTKTLLRLEMVEVYVHQSPQS